jgi:hypothetical protein
MWEKMDITWKYTTEIQNKNVFSEIEKERNIEIPVELKEFINKTNSGTPSQYNFMLGNIEKVFGAVLSYNKNEEGVDSVFTALEVVKNKDLLPFGIDPFGNYICYSLKEHVIVFWDHENNEVFSTKLGLKQFIDSLY